MLNHLKYFYQVARSGSFSRAAGELFITQPALSRQIAALEEELGLQLFYRQGRKLTLTDAGRRLFNYAEKIMTLNHQAQKEMLELKDLSTGELTVGASSTIANYMLPPVLAKYRRNHPGIKISLEVGNTAAMEEAVFHNRVDLGLISSRVQNPRLFQEQFAEDELSLVVSPEHSLASAGDDLPLRQLTGETFLCRESGSDTQRLADNFLDELGVEPCCTVILGHTEAIKNGIIHNMGISLLSLHTCRHEFKLGLLVPVPRFKVRRPLQILYRKDARLSPAALMLAAAVKKYYGQQQHKLFDDD